MLDERRQQGLAVAILHADRHLVVAFKPAGIDVHGRSADAPGTLIAAVARLLEVDPRRLHPASRLDRPVSGLVPIARSKQGRVSLARQYEQREVSRTYLALARSTPSPPQGVWDAPIGQARVDPRRRVVGGPGAAPAVTRYRTLRGFSAGQCLIELTPQTGRTHQLRVHLGAAGCAVLGDRRYGGPVRITLTSGEVLAVPRVMLHAARLSLRHPETGDRVTFDAEIPSDMQRVVERLAQDEPRQHGKPQRSP